MSIKKISISWHCPILSWSETENKSRNIIQLCFYTIKYSTPLHLQKIPNIYEAKVTSYTSTVRSKILIKNIIQKMINDTKIG
jgi:hypothetical protein